MSKNIAIIGFMGAGKSSVTKRLSQILKRALVSTDTLIEMKEKKAIADIFRDSGEAYFRKLEAKVIAQLATKEDLVIDCGGGVILNEDNVKALKKSSVIFYLSASPKTIYERIKNQKHRPLLNVENPMEKIKELLSERKDLYEKAHHTINTEGKSIEQVVERILKFVPHDRT